MRVKQNTSEAVPIGLLQFDKISINRGKYQMGSCNILTLLFVFDYCQMLYFSQALIIIQNQDSTATERNMAH